MKILGIYTNNDYQVAIFEDGTKIRYNKLESFHPVKPECIDLKITNRCSGTGCAYCHEDSSPDGQHGDILNLPFLDSLLPYTELAIGGGNPLEHPDLTAFLAECRRRKIITNMTVNQKHFVDNWMQIDSMLTFQEIYGLGVSVTRVDEEFLNFVRYMNGMNIVFHVINGVIEPTELEKLYGMGYKILILGYKQFRRGEKFYSPAVQARMDMMSEKLPEILTQFNVVSFDNLALKQLPVREQMSDEDWEKFYMGDDGQFTMYIDAVKREFAKSSTSTERWPITGDIAEMFGVVKGDNK